MRWRPVLYLMMIAAGGAMSFPSLHAQSAAEVEIDIAAQPLDNALTEFARDTRVQVFYDSSVTRGLRASAVRGRFTPPAALRRLLAGSGLAFKFTGATSVVITRPAAPAAMIGTVRVETKRTIGDAHDEALAYARLLQAELQRAVQMVPDLAQGDYHATVQLRVAADGRVEHCSVLHVDSIEDREALLRDTLCSVRASRPPPARMPQPIRFQFRATPVVRRDSHPPGTKTGLGTRP